jgi:hypothetical protein
MQGSSMNEQHYYVLANVKWPNHTLELCILDMRTDRVIDPEFMLTFLDRLADIANERIKNQFLSLPEATREQVHILCLFNYNRL